MSAAFQLSDPDGHAEAVLSEKSPSDIDTPRKDSNGSIRSLGSGVAKRASLTKRDIDWQYEQMRRSHRLYRFFYKTRELWLRSPCTLQGCLQTSIALFYLFAVPYQIGFETDVAFNSLYVLGYTLDAIVLLSLSFKRLNLLRSSSHESNDRINLDRSSTRSEPMLVRESSFSSFDGRHSSSRNHGSPSISRSLSGSLPSTLSTILLSPQSLSCSISPLLFLLALPLDAPLWPTSAREYIPFVRLSRYAYAVIKAHLDLVFLERSQTAPFALTRMTRILGFILVLNHCLACTFFYVTTRPSAHHYSTAPWLASPSASPSVGSRYLRAMYWSFMTFTTVGHADVVAPAVNEPGNDWEVGAAIVVAVVATFAYIYINANFTTMMIRLNSRLEQYRAQLAGIDAYLTRNKVSKDVCRRVKRHFARSQQATASADKALLESLPGSLQREVLQDIHMRTLTAASTFVNLDSVALAQVCAVVRSVTYLPEEVLCQQGDVMTEMFFLEEGCVLSSTIAPSAEEEEATSPADAVQSKGKLSKWAVCNKPTLPPRKVNAKPKLADLARQTERMLKTRGSPMCEIAFLFGLRQEATLEAVSTCQCCSLQKSDYMALTQEFPDILEQAQSAVLAHMRENNDPMLEEVQSMQAKPENQIAKLADMLFAASIGNLETVKEAVEVGGVDVNDADYEGRTTLHIAASSNRMGVIEYLASKGANLSRKDNFGETPLANAVSKRHEKVVHALYSKGGELGWDEAEVAGILCEKAREGDFQSLTLILSCGANVNAADYDSRTCLHLAASEGLLLVCKLLLTKGADVNATDRWGGTPLRDAVREEHNDVARMLRGAGGELQLDEATASGEMCDFAKEGNAEKLELLLECGCDVNASDYDKRTCLHIAASTGSVELVESLLSRGANVNSIDRWGGTPLRDAVRENHTEVAKLISSHGGSLGSEEAEVSGELCELAKNGEVGKLEVLLACGVQISAADYDERTCLHLAASEGQLEIVELLLHHNADINPLDRWGGTPLYDAVREDHHNVALFIRGEGGQLGMEGISMGITMCELAREGNLKRLEGLVECGAVVNSKDHEDRTPLHIAASSGYKEMVEALVALGADPEFKDRLGITPRREAEMAGHTWPDSVWCK